MTRERPSQGGSTVAEQRCKWREDCVCVCVCEEGENWEAQTKTLHDSGGLGAKWFSKDGCVSPFLGLKGWGNR